MLPQNDSQWPEGGEIDILEQVGSQPNVAHATLHTALFNHTHRQRPRRRNAGADGVQRLPSLPACLDSRLRSPSASTIAPICGSGTTSPAGAARGRSTRPFYLILNLAMGGDWAAAKGIDDAALPQRMEVDYVRVWEMPTRESSAQARIDAMRIFTIGYEGTTVPEFIAALKQAGVERVIDVRALPLSRRPGFSKSGLKAALEEAGIEYVHLKALGTPADGRPPHGPAGTRIWSASTPGSWSFPRRSANRRKCSISRARSRARCCAWNASRRIATEHCC